MKWQLGRSFTSDPIQEVIVNLDLVTTMEWSGEHTLLKFGYHDEPALFVRETPDDIIQGNLIRW